MPSVTLPTAEDKNIVRKALPTSKILTSAVARLYVAAPHTSSWAYSQRWGAATFCKDKKKRNAFFIRIVDMENQTGVIWEQELYEGFEYHKDATFFHTFGTDDYLAGLEFVDEGEAEVFYKKVINRESIRLKDDAKTNGGQWKISSRKSLIDKNDIGKPSDFRHLSHMGYTTDKGFTIENNDPEQNAIIDQLKALGITPEEINQNQDFIHQFLNQHSTSTSDTTNRNNKKSPSTSSPPSRSVPSSPVPNPPPLPSNKTGRRPPPPPPPRKKTTGPGLPSTPPPPPSRSPRPPQQRSVPPPPPPAPAPPQRGARQTQMAPPSNSGDVPPPPPPPPPMMNQGVPPPPPPPMMNQGVPPPPPPPMMNQGVHPPPPPPAPPAPAPPSSSNGGGSPLPPASDGRSNLMASIRATGGIGTLKKSGQIRKTPSAAAAAGATLAVGGGAAMAATASSDMDDANGGGLASSLAAVLKQRQTAMQSDDEEEDDDDWE